MKKIILTDLDGTLVKGSLVLQHYGFLVNNGLGNENLYNSWLADVKNEKLIVEVATDYQRIIVGKTIEELKVKEFVSEFVKGDNFTGAFDLIKNNDTKKVIVSGSPQFLIVELRKRFSNNQSWDCMGSLYEVDTENKFTGKIEVPMFLADEKTKVVNAFLEAGFKIEYGLGDTMSDMPLLLKASIRILVSPTAHTLEGFSEIKNIIVIQ